jgi:hypothetical protein
MSLNTHTHTHTHTGIIATGSVTHLPQFNLTPIRTRVAKEHSELTAKQLDELELRYLRFLTLCKIEPTIKHEPDNDVDWYWHAHILHTKQYAEDCRRYFGYFLHHEPNASGQGCDDGCGSVHM